MFYERFNDGLVDNFIELAAKGLHGFVEMEAPFVTDVGETSGTR